MKTLKLHKASLTALSSSHKQLRMSKAVEFVCGLEGIGTQQHAIQGCSHPKFESRVLGFGFVFS